MVMELFQTQIYLPLTVKIELYMHGSISSKNIVPNMEFKFSFEFALRTQIYCW